MRKLHRNKCPYYLKRHWKLWSKEWRLLIRGRKRLPNFDWKNKREDLIENHLAKATKDHCCFCDKDQIAVGTGATIEHFKPKGKFPSVAYQYNNLYNCCNQCQKKSASYSNNLLRPDQLHYEFENYFEIDIHTGKLLPRTTATPANKLRAKATITAYKLNHKDRKRFRHLQLNNYLKYIGNALDVNEINNFSYRFFIEEYFRIMT